MSYINIIRAIEENMHNTNIRINPRFNIISFKQDSAKVVGNSIKPQEQDSVTLENKVEPPKISNMQLFLGDITDQQIAQINKAKMLPENARFEAVYAAGGRGGLLMDPYYEINLYVPYMPTFYKETRILPSGYEVVKKASNTGSPCAVRVKAN